MKKLISAAALLVATLPLSTHVHANEKKLTVGEFGEISASGDVGTASMSIPEFKQYFRYILDTDEVANITSQCRILTYIYHDIDFNYIYPVEFRIEAYSKTKLYKTYKGQRGRFPSEQRLCN
ncbi:hypothetical protein [Pseudoalteromonas piscicida]|uniref:Uncharacterized protein n=1 Tax=Pseudoalteromonas piscicida TaxID=43662 RepID=A0A2A5JKL9_PSEO7|nr:hypothetical protein [Pseudoalteromonas piscicida]PCK29966.1 hypothetical protein CEX98_20050 [Pseudoalteromonas piscicida]